VVFSPSLKGHSHLQSLMVQSVDPHAVMSAPELPQVSSPSSSLLARRGRQMPTLQCRTAAHGLAEEVATMERFNEQYEVLEALGKGCSGVVCSGRRREDGVVVAIKSTRTEDEELVGIAKKEFDILKTVDHPHIIKALDFFVGIRCTISVIEHVNGFTLDQAVRGCPKKQFEESISQLLFRQLLEAVDYLHQRRIIHRDIKADNILVSADLSDLHLVDFNTAQRLEQGGSLTAVGSLEYMAPEVMAGDAPTDASDIWCVGICLYFALAGRLPRRIERYATVQEFQEDVMHKKVQLDRHPWGAPCKSVLKKMHCFGGHFPACGIDAAPM